MSSPSEVPTATGWLPNAGDEPLLIPSFTALMQSVTMGCCCVSPYSMVHPPMPCPPIAPGGACFQSPTCHLVCLSAYTQPQFTFQSTTLLVTMKTPHCLDRNSFLGHIWASAVFSA